jgi:uncharacterized protein (TIGR03437 family)
MLGGGSVATTMATINTWINALNVIYERELSVRFVLPTNNDQVIFTAEPDGLTAGDSSEMLEEIRPIFESKLGLANYDLGEVLSPGGGGVAYIGTVCSSNNIKGGGVSLVSSSRPVGTGLGLITLAHEIGHQFAARHSFSDTVAAACAGSQFPTGTAYESFGGLTLMSYAEACTPIVHTQAAHFHSGSYAQMTAYLNNVATCAVTANTGNQTPTINAGANHTIPRGTPFQLTAVGNDPDASDVANLTYSWEQLDSGTNPPSADGSTGPLFRPFVPTANPSRTFPSLTYILNNTNVPPTDLFALKTAETLPNVAREMNFRCMIRDNRGGVNNSSVVLSVANAGPFLVTAPNTAISWTGGTMQNVTWSVNGTNAAPINCQQVKLSLSTDGGQTFPHVLAANAPNTGTANVTVPAGLVSSQARLKVEAVGNIFFDISDTNFNLAPGDACPAISSIAPSIAAVGSTITINGVNFTGVTAVKFANNVNASFTIDSDTKITATVPNGAVNGLITLSKASCSDKQTSGFSVGSGAAYVLSADDGSVEGAGGFTGEPQVHYVNRLTPTSYPATLTALTLFIPNSVPVGTDYRLVVGLNVSGATNIDKLTLQEFPIKTPSNNQLVTFPLPNVTLQSGDFVVGFAHVPQAGVSPIGVDGNSPVQNRSYYSFTGAVIAPGALDAAPTIITQTVAAIQQGSAAKTVNLATVSDAETAAGNLLVAAGATPTGITLANLTNTNGTVSAQITVGCNAAIGQPTIPLTVTDGNGQMTATNLLLNITANTPPTLGTYAQASLNLAGALDVSPNAAPTDNGSLKSITAAAPNFTGTLSVNPTTGAVSIANAGPAGQFTVTVTATDNCDATSSTQFTMNVIPAGVALEADVAPRPGGNGSVSIADWTQAGRFVAGLDTAAEGSEFQRVDCAPRASFGDGKLTIADWVQAGRYAAGLDPVVAAAGPTAPTPPSAENVARFGKSLYPQLSSFQESTRVVRAVSSAMLRGQVNSLSLQFSAMGNENALGFSLNFDPGLLSFYRATTIPGTTLTLNQKQPGQLGLLLAAPTGRAFAAGLQTLVTLEFIPNGGAETVATSVRFSDQVIKREAADVSATILPDLSFADAVITISGRAAAHVSAASYVGAAAASESMMSAFGASLATVMQAATTMPLPQTLGGTRVTIKDSAGSEHAAPLFFVSPTQVNYLVPAGVAEGVATVTITNAAGVVARGLVHIGRVAPAVFSADASGKGYAAADVQRIRSDGAERYDRVARFDPAQQTYIALPIELRADEQAFLVLYGTGLKHRRALSAVKANMGGIATEVLYVGPQGQFAGLDQINLRLPSSLVGRGDVTVELEIDGRLTNPVRIFIK